MRKVPEAIRTGVAFQRDDVDRLGGAALEEGGIGNLIRPTIRGVYFDLPLYDYIRECAEGRASTT